MGRLSISNPVVGLDGVEFTGADGGVEQKFVVYRDALEDLEYQLFETDEALMQAFTRHRIHIAEVAANAIAEGKGGGKPVLLQTLLL
jgi:hypothetical protein